MKRTQAERQASTAYRWIAVWLLAFALATIITDPDVFNLGQVLGFHHEPFAVLFLLAASALLVLSVLRAGLVVREGEVLERARKAAPWHLVAAWLLLAALAAFLAEPGNFQPLQLDIGLSFVLVMGLVLVALTIRARRSRAAGGGSSTALR